MIIVELEENPYIYVAEATIEEISIVMNICTSSGYKCDYSKVHGINFLFVWDIGAGWVIKLAEIFKMSGADVYVYDNNFHLRMTEKTKDTILREKRKL